MATTVVGSALVACLYWAQAICVPVALATFLAFLLSPLVTTLHRRGLGRTPSVLLVVLAAILFLAGVAGVVGAQVKNLTSEVPEYTDNIKAKIQSLRHVLERPMTERLAKMAREITGELKTPEAGGMEGGQARSSESTVVVEPQSTTWLSRVPSVLSQMVEALGGLFLASVLLVFILLKREDLRNRLIRLVGNGRITATTKALDDAAQRVSRYLLMQLIVNSTFGLAITLGLLAIGVEHAILWGFMGATLRYVPYVGAWIAALGPVLLSLAMFPGWVQPLLVVGLFGAIELLTGNVIEPRLYGRSIGVSEIALLVAAAFWAFLWGPVGLVLEPAYRLYGRVG